MFIRLQKIIRPFWLLLGGLVLLFALQALWLCHAYQLTHGRFLTSVKEAFDSACQKEQTYRIPVADIINPGALTIQSCGSEEIRIIRKCPAPDTILYDNLSGQSLETFIGRAFHELRESIMPLNIYCLSDLFAGELYDRGIPLSFAIERLDHATGNVAETTAHVQNGDSDIRSSQAIIIQSPASDDLRAVLLFKKSIIFKQTAGVLIASLCLVALAGACFAVLFHVARRRKKPLPAMPPEVSNGTTGKIFPVGAYCFYPEKNELHGFGEVAYLNKKENAILLALCLERGNVVQRALLLEEHWGNTGLIYSRSLDTYIAKLRKYLKEDPSVQIATVKGQGYKLVNG
jgi:hypothetical protein